GKKVIIRRLTSLERAAECQLLFIAASEQRRLQTVLGRLRELPLLTVSDIDGFAFAGGMLELTMDRNRLTFIANNRQAKRQGLKISSQMLKLAREIVE
ncbi:MAG: YfiR family protein, partial [Geobacter sp.]